MGEKTAAKLVNEYGDLDTLYAHLDALSPKLRQNLAEHEERVRMNAEVIPLVRDVPLDTHVDQLTLGGWIEDDAREAFAELELRTIWNRIVALIREGAFGQPGGDAPRILGGRDRPRIPSGRLEHPCGVDDVRLLARHRAGGNAPTPPVRPLGAIEQLVMRRAAGSGQRGRARSSGPATRAVRRWPGWS